MVIAAISMPLDSGEPASFHEGESCLVLTLTEAISRALNDNRQLLDVEGRVVGARYDVELAEGEFSLRMVPNGRAGYDGGEAGTGWAVGGGVGFNKKWTTGTQLFVGPSLVKFGDHYRTEVRASLSQPLLRGVGRAYQLSGVRAARFAFRSACRDLHMAQVRLVMRTVQALYEVVKAEKSLELHKESHQRVEQFCRAAKLKEAMGLSDAFDLYRAESELRSAQDGLTAAHERLQETEDLVRDLLALPLDRSIQVELPLIYTPQMVTMDEAVLLALQNRIEVDQAEDLLWESRRLAGKAEKNLYPELNLLVNYSNSGGEETFAHRHLRHRDHVWGIGLTTSTDFNPLGDRLAYAQSRLGIETAGRARDQTLLSLSLDVKKALRQLERAGQRIQLQEEQMKTARGELYLAKVKFDRGMADNFNVMQAEKSLRSAQKAYWSALIDHIVGEYQLLAVVGLLIDKPPFPR